MEILENSLDVSLDEFLERQLMAHLATVSPEGYPRHAPVWFAWEDGYVWIIADRQQRSFPDRIEGQPRCALGIVDFDAVTGRLHHVGMRGTASIEPLDAGRAERLMGRYFRAEKAAWNLERFGDPQKWGDELVFVRFDPETVVMRDQSYEPPAEQV